MVFAHDENHLANDVGQPRTYRIANGATMFDARSTNSQKGSPGSNAVDMMNVTSMNVRTPFDPIVFEVQGPMPLLRRSDLARDHNSGQHTINVPRRPRHRKVVSRGVGAVEPAVPIRLCG